MSQNGACGIEFFGFSSKELSFIEKILTEPTLKRGIF